MLDSWAHRDCRNEAAEKHAIPGDAGIIGNEAANKLAKAATGTESQGVIIDGQQPRYLVLEYWRAIPITEILHR
ncbi:hypothetical protein K469DRAFT_707889 [Zopfia rhizophila CBS 207.26]|uniref:Uncharacterized protein n=1 Tax=Zopfia rhizophila CBS 207.26 TaxID=1314779 RepID=A0A6A6E132_9PEZI|nr:hypothetical protein K469DRAFT_707889 [Zopfia rhizophila CBS 207.26]